MSNKTENPSAFPWANDADKQYNWINKGMTLRDYFAAKAMQSYLSRLDMDVVPTKEHNQFKSICITSYYVAAEMMRARDL